MPANKLVTFLSIASNAVNAIANTVYANTTFASNLSATSANATTVWIAPQRVGFVALSNTGATVNANLSLSSDFSLNMLGNNAWTLSNPENLGTANGQSGYISIWNPTGGATLAFGSNWKPVGNTTPSLSTTANTMDLLCYKVESGTRIMYNLLKGFL
jgi:hypothetical protein